MAAIELWTNGAGMPSAFAQRARRAEANGWDGITIVDSQNLSGDCYVGLAVAAGETTRIRLGTGVTNPFTRHAAVTASAIATVHAVSGGRATLGIGRGDSALAHLGHAPASPEVLAGYLEQLQGYLRGDEVPFGDGGDLHRLGLAQQPAGSRIQWIRPGRYPKVPVDVAATGPKVIQIAARLADRITFAVGADPARLRWAIDLARSARAAAGLDPDGLGLGAYVNVVVHDDAEQARRLNMEAAKAVRYGDVTDDQAFAMVTINPAKQLKIENRDRLAAIVRHVHAVGGRVHVESGRPRARHSRRGRNGLLQGGRAS